MGIGSMDFDRGAATVTLPEFDAENAKPALRIGVDTTVSIGDMVKLSATALDSVQVVRGYGPIPQISRF